MSKSANSKKPSQPAQLTDENANQCIICCLQTDLFCVSACGHAVCFECGIRMRVVCDQLTCPVCRHKVTEMAVARTADFPSADSKRHFLSEQRFDRYGLLFESKESKQAVLDILAHVCTVCKDEPEFDRLTSLQRHMSHAHGLFYCKLCCDNLHLFTWERKCYSREQLVQHRRRGDSDDHSYRGHPACRFCDDRFMDEDALYKHLRRDHFFCQFCDADGFNAFYDDYPSLERHFKKEHYLCEEGSCTTEKGPQCAFRNLIDLKAHKVATHHAKEQIQQQLDFTFGPSSIAGQGYHSDDYGSRQANRPGAGRRPLQPNRDRAQRFGPKQNEQNPVSGPPDPRRQQQQNKDRRPRPQIPAASADIADASFELVPTEKSDAKSKVTTMYRVQTTANLDTRAQNRPNVDVDFKQVDFPSLAPGAVGGQQAHGSKWFGRVASSPNMADFPALRRGSDNRPALAESPKAAKENVRSTQDKSKDKSKRPGFVLIDDDDDFPSLAIEQKKEREREKENRGSGTAPRAVGGNPLSEPEPKPKEFTVLDYNDHGNEGLSNDENASLMKLLPQNLVVRRAKLRKMAARNQQHMHTTGEQNESVDDRATSRETSAAVTGGPSPPPGFESRCSDAPPPGFEALNSTKVRQIAPPHANDNNNMSGKNWNFIRPPKFDERNIKLFERIKGYFERRGNSGGINEFKNISRDFKSGSLSAAEFYSNTKTLFGKVEFKNIFPEMLFLLPDVSKQRDLLRVHLSEEKFEKSGAKVKKSAWGAEKATARGNNDILQSTDSDFWWACPDCGQIVATFDQFRHTTQHDVKASRA